LHGRLEFADDTGGGLVYVSAFTNRRAAAQLRFETYRLGSAILIHEHSTELLNGAQDFFVAEPDAEIFFTNYLQTMGVTPGDNTLEVGLDVQGTAAVSQLVVFGDSGIEHTLRAPPKLQLDVTVPERRIAVGDVFSIDFTLSNRGGFPAREVVATLRYPQEAMRVVGPESHRFAAVDGEERGEFSLQAMQAGHFELLLMVDGQSGGRRVATIGADID
jgi:hypothetical protein